MAVRTTETLVGTIVELDDDTSIDSIITVANVIVTKHCTDTALTATELELIERYLTAHLYSLKYRRTVSEKVSTIADTFQHAEDLGFNSTEFGQTAMRLDWSGALATLDKSMKDGLGRTVDLDWAGTENPDSIETSS